MRIPIVFFFIILTRMLPAQEFAGEYVLESNGGIVIFQIQNEGPNQLSGTLTDSDGGQFQMRGVVEQEYARGALASSRQNLYFEAHLNGGQLVMNIMPVDAYNQPDYLNATKFILNRREALRAPIELDREEPAPDSRAAGEVPRNEGGSWDGVYDGKINEVATQLTFRRYGNHLAGEMDAGGYRYLLEGAINGTEAWGDVLDPQTQGKMKFSGMLGEDVVELTFSGDEGQFRMQFIRQGASPPAGYQSGRNAALAGHWSCTLPPRSGEFAPPRQMMLALQPDGLFLYGEEQTVRASLKTGKNSGRQWMAKDGDLLIGQDEKWKRFAAYRLNGDALTLTLNSGEVQEWKRMRGQ